MYLSLDNCDFNLYFIVLAVLKEKINYDMPIWKNVHINASHHSSIKNYSLII